MRRKDSSLKLNFNQIDSKRQSIQKLIDKGDLLEKGKVTNLRKSALYDIRRRSQDLISKVEKQHDNIPSLEIKRKKVYRDEEKMFREKLTQFDVGDHKALINQLSKREKERERWIIIDQKRKKERKLLV